MKKKTENQIEFDKQVERLIKVKKKLIEEGYEAEGITMPQPPKIITRKYIKQLEGITYGYLKGKFEDQEIKQQDKIPELLQEIKKPVIGTDYRGVEYLFSTDYNKPNVDTNPTLLTQPLLHKRKELTEPKNATEDQEAQQINVTAGEVILENLYALIDNAIDISGTDSHERADALKSALEKARQSLGDKAFFENLLTATSERLIECAEVVLYASKEERAAIAYIEFIALLKRIPIDVSILSHYTMKLQEILETSQNWEEGL